MDVRHGGSQSARGAFLDAEPSEGRSEPAVLTDTWRASRMASRTDGGPRVLCEKRVAWPYVHPHGEDPQVAQARQDVLASQRSRLAGLALRPEPRPKARRRPTRFDARGDEPRRTEFDLQGQHFVGIP